MRKAIHTRRPLVSLALICALTCGFVLSLASDSSAKERHKQSWSWNWNGHGKTVKGSGVMISEKRKLVAFDAIEVDDATDIEVTIGENFEVTVEAEDNVIQYLVTEVSAGTLHISTDCDCNLETHKGAQVTITMPTLTEFELNGSSNVSILGLHGGELQFELTGSGDVELAGSVDELEIKINGSGDIDAKGLSAKDAFVSIFGSGDIEVTAAENLNAKIFGSGDIRYWGTPQHIKKSVSGSGDIRAGR